MDQSALTEATRLLREDINELIDSVEDLSERFKIYEPYAKHSRRLNIRLTISLVFNFALMLGLSLHIIVSVFK